MIDDIIYDYTFEIKKAKMSNVLLGNNKKNIIDSLIMELNQDIMV